MWKCAQKKGVVSLKRAFKNHLAQGHWPLGPLGKNLWPEINFRDFTFEYRRMASASGKSYFL